jgi:hypothetical protein
MNSIDVLYWIAGVAAFAMILHGLTDCFSRDARLGRKRRRNHGRVFTKARRPTVMLSVRTRKA